MLADHRSSQTCHPPNDHFDPDHKSPPRLALQSVTSCWSLARMQVSKSLHGKRSTTKPVERIVLNLNGGKIPQRDDVLVGLKHTQKVRHNTQLYSQRCCQDIPLQVGAAGSPGQTGLWCRCSSLPIPLEQWGLHSGDPSAVPSSGNKHTSSISEHHPLSLSLRHIHTQQQTTPSLTHTQWH